MGDLGRGPSGRGRSRDPYTGTNRRYYQERESELVMSESSLGCYSVVRYRDALSDQQINLGVLLWHPQEGFKVFFVPDLEGVRAISPKIPSQDLRFRLNVIQEEISHNGKSGSDK